MSGSAFGAPIIIPPPGRYGFPLDGIERLPGRQTAWRYWRCNGEPPCFWCGKSFTRDDPPTRDHVIPKSTGGSLNDGLVLACHDCNVKRGNLPFDEYRKRVSA